MGESRRSKVYKAGKEVYSWKDLLLWLRKLPWTQKAWGFLVVAVGGCVSTVIAHLRHWPLPLLLFCAIVTFALLVLIASTVYLQITERKNPSIEPDNGPKTEQYIDITNNGEETTFRAECWVESVKSSHPAPTGMFKLGWNPSSYSGFGEQSVKIPRHNTSKLLIATSFALDKDHSWFDLRLQLIDGDDRFQDFHKAMWSAFDNDLPRYTLRVMIIAEGTKRPKELRFLLYPETSKGPLKMEELKQP